MANVTFVVGILGRSWLPSCNLWLMLHCGWKPGMIYRGYQAVKVLMVCGLGLYLP